MKALKFTFTIIVLLIYSESYSQSNKYLMSLDAGINEVLTFDKNYSSGFAIGVKGGFRNSNNIIQGVKLDLSSNSLYEKESVNLGLKAFLMYGNFRPTVKFTPYFLLGAGADMVNTPESSAGDNFNLKFGLDFAIGAGYKFREDATIYLETKFSAAFTGTNDARAAGSLKTGVMYSF